MILELLLNKSRNVIQIIIIAKHKENKTSHYINKYRTHVKYKITFPHTKSVWYDKTHNRATLYMCDQSLNISTEIISPVLYG